jgi:hypothetical protein
VDDPVAALRPPTADELDTVETLIEVWLHRTLDENPLLVAVERDADAGPGDRRWFARLAGEDKDTFTLRLTLRQRMLHYETYMMPGPEENHARFFKYLLARNRQLVGVSFCLGEEEAVFLVGAVPVATLDDRVLDRILGTVWASVERCFRAALMIGFASRFGN